MTLKINTQEDDRRQLNVTVEVPEDRLGKAMKKTAKKMARQVRVPGFRPGKAPYSVIKSYFGEGAIRGEALNDILPAVAQEAMEQLDAEPYAQVSLDEVTDEEGEPVTLKMTVPLEPIVQLHDYRSIRKEVEPVHVTDEAVDEAIENLLERHATFETVERAAEMGDMVTIAGTGYLDGDESDVYYREESQSVLLDEDIVFPGTKFAKNIEGMKAGEEKSFSFKFSKKYEEDESVQGKKIDFSVTMQEVQSRSLPELTDEFAKEIDENLDSAEQLRAEMADGLKTQAERQFNDDLVNGWVAELNDNVEEMVYPQGAVEQEIDGMVNNLRQQINQMGWDWESYLSTRETGEEGLREDFEEEAVDRLEKSLVFQQFVKTEQIELDEEEVSAEITKRIDDLKSEDEDFKKRFTEYLEGVGNVTIRNELVMSKVYERIQAIYAGKAPKLPKPKTEDSEKETKESKPKKKKSTKKATTKKTSKKKADDSAE